MAGRYVGAGPSPYAQALARAGLHPDNPDEMYKQLLFFIASPKAFKDRDPNWPGARDNLAWWEEPHGTATLPWPFHGGKWYDACPKNEAQARALFKCPDKVATKAWLSHVWGFPMSLRYQFRCQEVKSGFDLFKTAGSILDSAGKFLRQIPGVTQAVKLEIDLDFAALGILVNTFVPSPGADILHGLGDVAQDTAKRAVDGLGPKSPPEIVDTILKALHFLGDANILVRYLIERLMTAQRFDAAFFNALLNFDIPPGATDHERALAMGAKDVWTGSLDSTLRRIIPPLVRLVTRLAFTGKVVKSDLLALLNMPSNPAIEKMLDLFGIRDSAAPAPPPPPPARAAPPPKPKVLQFNTGPTAPLPPKPKVIQFHTGPQPPPPGVVAVPLTPPPVPPAVAPVLMQPVDDRGESAIPPAYDAPPAAPQWVCQLGPNASYECGWV
jgi:hypothetical protein